MFGNFIIILVIKLVLVNRFVCCVSVVLVLMCVVMKVDKLVICEDFFFKVFNCFWKSILFKFFRWFFRLCFLLLLKKNFVFVRCGCIIFLLLEIIWIGLWFLMLFIKRNWFERFLLVFKSGMYFWLFFMV